MSKESPLPDTSLVSSLRNLHAAERFAFDIGSSVIRVTYTSCVPKLQCRETETEKDIGERSKEEAPPTTTRLHCIHFPHTKLALVCDLIAQDVDLKGADVPFSSTSQTKNTELFIEQRLGIKLHKVGNIECLVQGTNFLLLNIIDEVFVYDHHNDQCRYNFHTIFSSPHSAMYPYVLVNLGTGMSIFLVESDSSFYRLGGSHVGGGVFYGLAELLTGITDIDKLLDMAEDGDHRSVDRLVSDIYGDEYDKELLGLTGDIIAGSFSKCSSPEYAEGVKSNAAFHPDIVRSLLLMISNNIGQVVSLFASSAKTRRVFFNGYLVRNRPIIMRTISYATSFWSKGTLQAHFLRHEAYTTAIGALVNGRSLLTTEEQERNIDLRLVSWRERYAGCSDLGRFVPQQSLDVGMQAEVLELDSAGNLLQPFPLISSQSEYVPDTVNLNTDMAARQFWISCMEESVHQIVEKAVSSQPQSFSVKKRGEEVARKYLEQLRIIKEKPFAYGSCNVRNLLDLREQIFNEQDFDDPYSHQKMLENALAIKELPAVLRKLDSIEEERTRLSKACEGLLAGNVFDWGAKEVVKLLEGKEQFTFTKAVECIPSRPWLVDYLDEFLDETLKGKTHKCAAIFVDNSGADAVLGVLPFARELLKRGTKVVIISNLLPALNDITFPELIEVIEKVVEIDVLLREKYKTRQLMIAHSGQGSPCLDLRRVNADLCSVVLGEKVDLVVIEGMGRSLHTNYEAKFSVDSLKIAVIKNQWLADRMGGKIFSVVFKFEKKQH